MSPRIPTTKTPVLLLALAVLASLVPAALGIQPAAEDATKAMNEFTSEILAVAPSLEVWEPSSEKAFANTELQGFLGDHSSNWKITWDSRSDRPHLVQGEGIPLIPGKGNSLGRGFSKLGRNGELRLEDVARLLEGFTGRKAGLLGTEGMDLRVDHQRSSFYGDSNYWTVEFRQFHQGVPVEDAYVFYRVNNGNIVQFGTQKIADVDLDVVPLVDSKEALDLAFSTIGVDFGLAHNVSRGELKILPAMDADELKKELYKGAPGLGYRHLLIWDFTYRLKDNDHAFRVRVDAHSGEVLEHLDLTRFAQVSGDIYPVTNTDPLATVGFPSCSVSNSGTKITDANGNYTYSGGNATSTLSGRYVNINDNCGSISLSDASTGNLDFGGSGGTDCTTPGFGGAGNTHSARSGFYHLTNINRKAASFHPSNSWLDGTLTANMNINNTCNAFWNGSTVNFYRSGGGCANTGELAAVFLHEWGHGMDDNTGGSASENGSGEAVGDTFAFLETRDSCIGQNFLSSPCHNCGTCTGVRDVAAFAIGGISTIARPDTVTSNTGINCDRWSCPYLSQGIFPYQGPMGYEGHCESYIASSANWDLTQMLITEHGTDPGWAAMDAIWYGSLIPSKSAYRVASGGTCNPSATVDGCAATNWYTVYLSVDDDDGNLANGTPNACRIWDAFDAHGIACGTRPDCSIVCDPAPIANAGADRTINEGDSTTIGTAAQPDTTYSWSPGGATTATVSVSPTTTTTYTVTATTSCGSAQDSVTVTVIPAGSNGPQTAVYDSGLGAPKCSVAGSSCDSTTLVDGRANLGPEPNQPNTLDVCNDGTSGTYHSDESNDRIVVSSLDGGNLSEGDTVQVDATVYAWSTGSSDTLDLYYAADANNPTWVLITSIGTPSGGSQTLSAQYTLPSGGLQAVRANFRYQGSASSCSTGAYDDHDDLVFAVETSGCTSDLQCDNGLFCDGAETCDIPSGTCQAGIAPTCDNGLFCDGGETCNESTDSCDAGTPPACNDGLFCNGTESCNEGTDSCDAGTAPVCDDGAFCNGTESCNEGTDSCDAGIAPCDPGTETCNESSNSCDLIGCTSDLQCDNGLFCDGSETCDIPSGVCLGGTPPTCEDGLFCNGIGTCNEGTDSCDAGTPPACDDGLFCNGTESCNEGTDSCDAGTAPVCDDGAFCNGDETCNEGTDSCDAGTDPCLFGQTCNEPADVCEGGPVSPVAWMSFRSNTAVPGVGTVTDEDIVSYDEGTGLWQLEFDGSDVGLGSLEISGLAVLPGGDLLLSFTAAGTVGGMAIDDSDIVRFTPTSMGSTTAGSFSVYFDGSDVSLTSNGEDVDSIALAADGRLIVSTLGGFSGSGASGADEDLFIFTGTLGAATSGSFAQYFDGSDVGLNNSSSEDVDAATLTVGGNLLFSTVGTFAVSGVGGEDEDVVEFAGTFGSSTSGSFSMRLDLSTLGIAAGEDIGGLHIVE